MSTKQNMNSVYTRNYRIKLKTDPEKTEQLAKLRATEKRAMTKYHQKLKDEGRYKHYLDQMYCRNLKRRLVDKTPEEIGDILDKIKSKDEERYNYLVEHLNLDFE